MQTTKRVFYAMFGLAMMELFIGQSSLHAAVASKVTKPLHASCKPARSAKVATAKSKSALKGVAAVYADMLSGRKTASGQKFCQNSLTAAHRSLPLGTKVRVTNVSNHKSIEVLINDRGPWQKGRVIDLSAAAAAKVGMPKRGTALVTLEVVDPTAGNES
jgi:rare lipoprotein A